MSELEARAEIIKLARELGADPEELEFLAASDAADLAAFRHVVAGALHDAHTAAFERASAVSALLPTALTAKLAQTLVGPYLSARIAAVMPEDRAVKLASHLEPAFLADVTLTLDPGRASGIVARLPDDTVLTVAGILLERGEYVTLGRFVDVVSDDVVRGVLARIDSDTALLELAFAAENKARLDDLLGLLSDDHIAGIVRAAAAHGMYDQALTVLSHISGDSRRRVADIAAGLGDEVIAGIIATTHREGLWADVLPLFAVMSPDRRRIVVNHPATRDPDHARAIVAAVAAGDLWDDLLPLVAEFDHDHLAVLAALDDVTAEELTAAATAATRHPDLWPMFVRTVARLDDAEQRRLAATLRAVEDLDLDAVLALAEEVDGAADLPLVRELRA